MISDNSDKQKMHGKLEHVKVIDENEREVSIKTSDLKNFPPAVSRKAFE